MKAGDRKSGGAGERLAPGRLGASGPVVRRT